MSRLVASGKPLVSIIMPVYNGERFLVAALNSVFSQTFTDYEIIVINDGSSDGSAEMLSSYHDQIIYIEQNNKGIAGAYNTGIEKSSGEYISFIEQDDVWLPRKLENEVKALQQNSIIGMAYSLYYVGDEYGRYDDKNVSQLVMSGDCFSQLLSENLEGNKIVPFSSVMVRADVIREIGPLNSRLNVSIDYDAWLKVAFKCHICCIEEPSLIYRQHSANTSKNSLGALLDDAVIIELWVHDEKAKARVDKLIVKKRLGDIYSDIAWAYSRCEDRVKESSYRLRVLGIRPTDPGAWLNYAKSFVGYKARRKYSWYWTRLHRFFKQSLCL